MAERITIEKIKALEAEYEVTIPDEIKKLLCEGEIDRSRRKVHLRYGEWECQRRVSLSNFCPLILSSSIQFLLSEFVTTFRIAKSTA